MITDQPYTRGLPPSPKVEIITTPNGSKAMPAGTYYFVMMADLAIDADPAFQIMRVGRTGIDAYSPPTKVTIPSVWYGLSISNVPLSDERPSIQILMSRDDINYYQIGSAPVVPRPVAWEDPEHISGSFDPTTGLYVMNIANFAQLLTGELVGQMIMKKSDPQFQPPKEKNLEEFFDPVMPGLVGIPQPKVPPPQPTAIRDVNKTIRAIPTLDTGATFAWPEGMEISDPTMKVNQEKQVDHSSVSLTPATAVLVMGGLLVGYFAITLTR